MSNLQELAKKCKWSFSIEYNPHKDNHQSVLEWLCALRETGAIDVDFPDDISQQMEERDTTVAIHYYPNNCVGFFTTYSYDIDLAIEDLLNALNEFPNVQECDATDAQ